MSTGSGSDPHMLALLRAMRLRSAAPDAAAAGEADAAAALSARAAQEADPEGAEPVHPEALLHPHWPAAHQPAEQHILPQAELPSAHPLHELQEPGVPRPERTPAEATGDFRAGLASVPSAPRPSQPAVPPATPASTGPSTGSDTTATATGSDVSSSAAGSSGTAAPAAGVSIPSSPGYPLPSSPDPESGSVSGSTPSAATSEPIVDGPTPSATPTASVIRTPVTSPTLPTDVNPGHLMDLLPEHLARQTPTPAPSQNQQPQAGSTIPAAALPPGTQTPTMPGASVPPPAGAQQPGTPTAGVPSPGTPAAGASLPGAPLAGTLIPGAPTPLPGASAPGTPLPGASAPGTPLPGAPTAGTTLPGAPAPGAPLAGAPSAGTPLPGTPAAGRPAPGTPAPAPGTSAPGTPAPPVPGGTGPGNLPIPTASSPVMPRPPQGSPVPGTPILPPGAVTPALPPVPGATTPALPSVPGGATPALPSVPGGATPALPPVPGGATPVLPSPTHLPGGTRTGVPAGRPTIPYPPGAGPWPGGLPASTTRPIEGIPGIGGPRPVGPAWPGDPVQLVGPAPPLRPAAPIPPARTMAPVDGMNPADDAMMHEVQRLLSNSLSLAGGPPEVAARLRAALVQAEPGLFRTVPGNAASQTEQLADGLTWLVHNFDQPPALVAGFGRLGAALAECGIAPQQLQLAGAALAEAMRAGMAANGWRQDFDQAWRSTWQHAYEWIAHGMATARYEPTTWTAVVVSHERRRDDLAVVRLRPYLPMPYLPGQYARIEVPELPGVWRPYSLAGAPRRDNVVELHVRAKSLNGVSGTLVHRLAAGDKVRIARAEGRMCLPDSGRDLLMIAGDTGVAPLKALLTELAATGDPRSVVLFWGARTLSELYDIDEIAAIAGSARRATVVPVISEGPAGPYASGLVTDAVAAYGEWSEHEVYLAGPPLMLAATTAALYQLGVAPERIHHDAPE
ncbi:hypothetical protein [Actinoplanes sp. NPDC049681]|uniref:hypothetical protein n=1 Tax=Actinoplanes sp. NPDC049681 TaxID=3363905 RepID=UPI0037B66891